MSTSMEDLRLLQNAEAICDEVWDVVEQWTIFQQRTVGQQLVRSIDSVGANIAESYGRFHYGEKIQFLYYARGSIYETKFWLRRATVRKLMPVEDAKRHADQLESIAKSINAFNKKLRQQKRQQ